MLFFSKIEDDLDAAGNLGEKTEGLNTLGALVDGIAGMALLGFVNSYCAQLVEAIKQKTSTRKYFFIPNTYAYSHFERLK
jgi:hypothetical protein